MTDRAQLAADFATFCDGAEEAGLDGYAHRGRSVAHELLDALSELEAERSARVAIQAERDRVRNLLFARGVDVD